MKQALRTYLPKLNEVVMYNDFLNLQFDPEHSGQKFIASCDGIRKKLHTICKKNERVFILIVPEGDFT